MQEPQSTVGPLPNWLERELKLLLSVDIVGSTEFKSNTSRGDDGRQPWLRFFEEFYDDFRGTITFNNSELSAKLTPWKVLGDEIIFHVTIDKVSEIIMVIASFVRALERYQSAKPEFQKAELALKGAAWLVGFPVINAKIVDKLVEVGKVRDYIGPSVDAGFRIAKFSNQRIMCLSVELAYALAQLGTPEYLRKPGVDSSDRYVTNRMYFWGTEKLKGVLQNADYPLYYIHTGTEAERTFLADMGINPSDPQKVVAHLDQFIRSNRVEAVSVPYIVAGQNREAYNAPPAEHVKWYDQMVQDVGRDYHEVDRTEGQLSDTASEQLGGDIENVKVPST